MKKTIVVSLVVGKQTVRSWTIETKGRSVQRFVVPGQTERPEGEGIEPAFDRVIHELLRDPRL